MSSNGLAEKAAVLLNLERGWTRKLTASDPVFTSLPNVKRDHAYLGRLFVAWHMQGDQPQIDTLFKVDRFGVNANGMNMTIATVSANQPDNLLRVSHVPVKVPHLNLYFWIPYFAEVRSVPYDPSDPTSRLTCSLPLLIKYRNPLALGQVEGRLYFASKSEFCALWPDHAF
jgi:hypothetical protein